MKINKKKVKERKNTNKQKNEKMRTLESATKSFHEIIHSFTVNKSFTKITKLQEYGKYDLTFCSTKIAQALEFFTPLFRVLLERKKSKKL